MNLNVDDLLDVVGDQVIVPDNRPSSEWALDLTVPNSARTGGKIDISTTPHLQEPIDELPDNSIREAVLMMPIGSGKTTVFDVHVPRAIVQDPGSILLTMQGDDDANGYWDERLEPILLSHDRIKRMAEALPRNKKRKGEWILPHLTLNVRASKLNAYQRVSRRWVFLDEAWLMKHGYVEQARGRTHRRWNARVVLTSQGGWTHIFVDGKMVKSELESAWIRTDRRQRCIVCPECGHTQQWLLSSLKWVTQTGDDGLLDQKAITESTRYHCIGDCKTAFEDKIDVRRALAMGSIYQPTNPKALPGYVGWHCNVLCLYWQPWWESALKFAQANVEKKNGDSEPLRLFIQRELAENSQEESADPDVVLKCADYSIASYVEGQLWDGEIYRFMTIDRQRDHFWHVIRAWQNDGSSRLIACGKIQTVEMCREQQLRYKVQDRLTFEDARHEPGIVYDDCAKYGWTALHGTKYDSYTHHPPDSRPVSKLYSQVKDADAPTVKGRARYILLATDKIKDQLAHLLAGRGPAFESAKDAGKLYESQMQSEAKKDVIDKVTKAVKRRWVKIRANHMWDCEAYQVAVAIMLKLLKGPEKTFVNEEAAAKAQAESEEEPAT